MMIGGIVEPDYSFSFDFRGVIGFCGPDNKQAGGTP